MSHWFNICPHKFLFCDKETEHEPENQQKCKGENFPFLRRGGSYVFFNDDQVRTNTNC